MRDAFGYVLFGVVIVGGIAAAFTLFGTGNLYKEIGKGGLFEDDEGRRRPPATSGAVYDEEIRQLLTARNEMRSHRGEAAVDVEDELRALTRPAVDAEIEDEIRGMVERRNRRRVERGEAPLDVDAEVARRIAELSG